MGAMAPAAERDLLERVYWLIRLRWIAAIGVILVVLSARTLFRLALPFSFLFALAIALCVYNLAFLVSVKKIDRDSPASLTKIIGRVANAQISLDLLTLTGLIHLSGGVENPFIFYFIFHMIIASILLSRRAAFAQAAFATFLFLSLVGAEYFNFLPHYRLGLFAADDFRESLLFVSGMSFVFVSTMFISVYLASSIARKLREREKSLKMANELLTEKDRIKSEYVLRVTHDIKEDLAAIQSCIEPVTAGITGALNEKQTNLLLRADERTERLLFFVRALLEVTRLKLSREIKMEYFSLPDALSEAVARVSSKARDKDISIDFSLERSIDKIRGGREYIQETIVNLLANSVKYTPRGGKIVLGASDKGSSVLIQIKDTGIGIPKEELPKIFEEFYRASNAKEVERDGTGLGLSIARQVVERHQGKIWAESEEGHGSTFSIILPK